MSATSTFASVLMMLAVALVVPASQAHAQQTPERLAALSREASTAREHAMLAREYRLQAESFEAQAEEHEARGASLLPGIAHKWPAMTPGDHASGRQRAVEARRAARGSRQMAERHVQLAVETQALAIETTAAQ